MAFVRVYTGDDGQSHLEDLDLLPADLPDFEKLMLFAATNISFKRLPDGYFLDFHASHVRLFQVYMSGGQYEVGVGDGTSRWLGPGDVLLFEDVTGQGHTSRCKGDLVAADIALPSVSFGSNLLQIRP